MGRKQFFDKKNARHFKLVHRSVLEGGGGGMLARGEGEGEAEDDRVFAEVTPDGHFIDDNNDEEIIDVESVSETPRPSEAGEAAKYGIYFDDRSYDYTRHLRPIGTTPGAVYIPASHRRIEEEDVDSVAATTTTTTTDDADRGKEEASSRLNHAIYDGMARLDLDPVVKETLVALEDEEYICSDLEDDFIVRLDQDAARVLVDDSGMRSCSRKDASEDESYFEIEEFEEEDGDCVDIIDEFSDEGEMDSFPKDPMAQLDLLRRELMGEDPEGQKERILKAVCKADERSESEEVSYSSEDLEEDDDGFDCQTILSTRTNTENHPGLISEQPRAPIRISSRTGMPLVPEFHGGPGGRRLDQPVATAAVNKGIPRPKEETTEEKRLRKAAIKEAQRLKRASKKNAIISVN